MIKKIHIITLLFLGFILISFYKKSPYHLTRIPPGTVKIDSNLFIDKTEITNFSWLEYMYWIERVYGKESAIYKACLPKENLWLNEDSCLFSKADYYLQHPNYRNFPVVGITQEQALKFCKWRSDRVFEILMIENKIMQHTPNQNENNYFSIESYFDCTFLGKKPDLNFKYVPYYRLPTEEEWKKSKVFFDDYNKENLKTCKKKYCNYHISKDSLEIVYNVVPCIGDSLLKEPLKSTKCYKNENIGFHFYGNVSEWLQEDNIIIGGNWKDTTTSHFNTPVISREASNTIGFRAICEWKEFKIVN